MLAPSTEFWPMSSHLEVSQALALASEWQDWNCWRYTSIGHRLILRGRSGPTGYSPERQAFLAFRFPRYVRLPWFLYAPNQVQFEFGVPAPTNNVDSEQGPVAPVGAWEVQLRSGEQTYKVQCEGVGFHVGPDSLPSAFHPSVDFLYRSHEVVRLYDGDSQQRLQTFLGGTAQKLEWNGLHVSHGQFRLLASGLPSGEVVELRFFGTHFLDLPTRMSEARLSVATASANQALRGLIPPRLLKATYPPQRLVYRLREGETARPSDEELGGDEVLRPGDCAGHIVIDCREGTFHLLAAQVALRRLKRRSNAFSRYLARPLWNDGPPVAAM